MINSFKNPAIMRILRTTERHGAGWREQNFIPDDETHRLRKATIYSTKVNGFFYILSERNVVPAFLQQFDYKIMYDDDALKFG